MDPHSRALKKKTNHGNEVLSQDTTHLIQRPREKRGSTCKDSAGNWTTRRPPDDRKEAQTAVVWSCFPFIRSRQNHLAMHSERGKKIMRTKKEVGRQHQGMDRPGVRQVPEGSGEQGKWRKLVAKSSVVPQLSSRLRKIDDDDDDNDETLRSNETYISRVKQTNFCQCACRVK